MEFGYLRTTLKFSLFCVEGFTSKMPLPLTWVFFFFQSTHTANQYSALSLSVWCSSPASHNKHGGGRKRVLNCVLSGSLCNRYKGCSYERVIFLCLCSHANTLRKKLQSAGFTLIYTEKSQQLALTFQLTQPWHSWSLEDESLWPFFFFYGHHCWF